MAETLDAIGKLAHVRVRGLMTIPPEAEKPDDARPWFRRLRELAERHGLPELSMGMSGDFEVAIEEGATMVRVGTAIFGPARMSVKGKRVGFVGGGNMGEALIQRPARHRPRPRRAAVGHRRAGRAHQPARDAVRDHRPLRQPRGCVREADVVILAVKPQIMAAVLGEIAPAVTAQHLLISIAAGVSTATIRAALGKDARIIRVMPNTPALVLRGATAIARGRGLAPDDLATAEAIFGAVGRAVVLDEELMDAVTGLSGSGPAYVAIVIESLADGGVKMGLDRATAMTLATQTVLGAAHLLAETGLHPGALKDMVSSPGGTTIAGIAALEEGGIRTTFIGAVERATQRSRELGRGPA